jgi:hypothetical protein
LSNQDYLIGEPDYNAGSAEPVSFRDAQTGAVLLSFRNQESTKTGNSVMKENDQELPQRKLSVKSSLAGLGLLSSLLLAPVPGLSETESVIVQGPDLATAKAAVLDVGGEVTHELGIINAVGAQLTAEQRKAIEAGGDFRVRSDSKVQTNPVEPDK